MMRLEVPADYFLPRDYCSYGYFLLWPNHWEVGTQTLTRALEVSSGPVLVRVRQGEVGEAKRLRLGRALDVSASRSLRAGEWAEVTKGLSRMLRLDDGAGQIREFHRLDPRWKRLGRGRLMRSPTLFEDVIKTVTSCNVQWPSTIVMNRRLCEVVGVRVELARREREGELPVTHTFPSAAALARSRAGTLRSRCRTGYRDARIIELARRFSEGAIDQSRLESAATSDEEVFETLLELPGIGPYAAANIMQLLGRYSRLPLDSESVRHGKAVLGMRGTDKRIMRRIERHFGGFGAHKFRSYWFELWDFYEAKRGPSWTWDRDTTGATFTASQL